MHLPPCPTHVGDIGDRHPGQHEGQSLVTNGQGDRYRTQQRGNAEADLEQHQQAQPRQLGVDAGEADPPLAPEHDRQVSHDEIGYATVNELHGQRVFEEVAP